jgi:hypothetical protein
MGMGPEPYHLQIRNAANCVWGGIPGGVLTGDGTLLNRDTSNWAPWKPKVGNADDALEMIRTVTALRRGPGKDFLVFGRMLKPATLDGVRLVEWTHEGRQHQVPAVFHAAWQAPDGRLGIVLANWTTDEQEVILEHPRLSATKAGEAVVAHESARQLVRRSLPGIEGQRNVTLPPLACALVEARS